MHTVERSWARLAVAVVAGLAATVTVGQAPAAAVEGGTPTAIQLGDSFASGEGGGWLGNSAGVGSNAGNRQGTDLAARQQPDGSWDYLPAQYVYESDTYRERDGWWGNNPCHRSLDAPIQWVNDGPSGFSKVLNLACSGARNRNLWLPANGGVEQHSGLGTQLEQLRSRLSSSDDVKLVVIGVGGNDINVGGEEGFGNLVKQCMVAYAKTYLSEGLFDPQYCKDDFDDEIGDAISSVFYNALKTIDQVRQVLTEKGQALGTYKIVLTGYPSITPTDWGDWRYPSEVSNWSGRCPVRRPDSTWINLHLVTRLNDVLQAAAEEKAVGFIDLRNTFNGHRLCESGTLRGTNASQHPDQAEWVRFLDISDNIDVLDAIMDLGAGDDSDETLSDVLNSQRSIAESFHPNYWGQRALGHCLHAYYVSAPANSHQECFIAGVGPYDHPDYMNVRPLPAHVSTTDDPSPNASIGIPRWPSLPTTRQITVPDAIPAGHYVQWLPDLTHARKGQLRVHLTAPDGTVFVLRDYNPNDTGAWANGTFTRDYTADPSGTWTLAIWDNDLQTYNGTLNMWSIKLF